MPVRFLLPLLAILALLPTWGCQSTPSTPAVAPEPTVAPPAPRTDGLSPAAHAARESLESAEAMLRTGDWVGARALFSMLDEGELVAADQPRHRLLAAELAIRSGELDEAARLLLGLDARRLPDPLDARFAQARLAGASGAPAAAARSLMALDAAASARQKQNDTIWELVTQTPVFEALALADQGDPTERDWWVLRRELLRAGDRADRLRRIAAWQAERPDHPAARVPPAVLGQDDGSYVRPRQAALMLPLSGPLARAGRAIRDGFVAAYLEQAGALEQAGPFTVAVYDTEGRALSVVYEQALAEGADLLIGPLQRERVAELNSLAPEVPVLALNYLGQEPPAPNLAQLGLSIEDDAATIATALRQQGIERVMVLHGPHDWALRVRQALDDMGLETVATHRLPDLRTITESVGRALDIEGSHARHTELQRLLGVPLQFAPRRRTDVAALVALVNALEMTALGPALRFHYAQDIPVYATSQTLQGAGTAALRAMEGMLVADLPWRAPGDPGYRMLADAFPVEGNPFASMYALGADAFRLVDRIHPANRATAPEMLGNTGVLTLQGDGRIRRELELMRVTRGSLTPGARRLP
ncbi:MAG: penicillin-binding protein activator [Pseudomonadales bacterium]|nr:penicillin-binding protein activator [Pseudomonadales bacterium]